MLIENLWKLYASGACRCWTTKSHDMTQANQSLSIPPQDEDETLCSIKPRCLWEKERHCGLVIKTFGSQIHGSEFESLSSTKLRQTTLGHTSTRQRVVGQCPTRNPASKLRRTTVPKRATRPNTFFNLHKKVGKDSCLHARQLSRVLSATLYTGGIKILKMQGGN